MKRIIILLFATAMLVLPTEAKHKRTLTEKDMEAIRSGELWLDNKGEHINAHGGGIMKYGDTYYWFGEHKSEHTSDALVGVMCYSSKDLVNWRNCGVALSVTEPAPNLLSPP